jgi:hypothetical protein
MEAVELFLKKLTKSGRLVGLRAFVIPHLSAIQISALRGRDGFFFVASS